MLLKQTPVGLNRPSSQADCEQALCLQVSRLSIVWSYGLLIPQNSIFVVLSLVPLADDDQQIHLWLLTDDDEQRMLLVRLAAPPQCYNRRAESSVDRFCIQFGLCSPLDVCMQWTTRYDDYTWLLLQSSQSWTMTNTNLFSNIVLRR